MGRIPEPICSRVVRAAMKPSWLTASKLYASGTKTMSRPARSKSASSATASLNPPAYPSIIPTRIVEPSGRGAPGAWTLCQIALVAVVAVGRRQAGEDVRGDVFGATAVGVDGERRYRVVDG